MCGDAFDRGKDAVRVYKYLKELHSKGKLIYIRGNHEDLIAQKGTYYQLYTGKMELE